MLSALNGHAKFAAPDDETCHDRFPLSNFPPQAVERANESLREFHVKCKLYGTQFCHLCDEAKAILDAAGVEFEYLDIAGDDELLERYGTRIPVLQRMDTNAELGWPFDAGALLKWWSLGI